MYMCVCVSYVCASIAHTRMCRIITGQKESLEKVPSEMTELWSKAVRTNARAVKTALFNKWLEAGQSWSRCLICMAHFVISREATKR